MVNNRFLQTILIATGLPMVTAAHAAEPLHPAYCNPLLEIIQSAEKNHGFERFVDSRIKSVKSADGVAEYYFSTFGFGVCVIDKNIKKPKIICSAGMLTRNPSTIMMYYRGAVYQTSLCLADKITKSEINLDPDEKQMPNFVSSSTFYLSDKLRFEVNLAMPNSPLNLCAEMPYKGCEDHYGIVLRTILEAQ